MASGDLPNQAKPDQQTDRENTYSFEPRYPQTVIVSQTDMKIMRILHTMNSEPVKLEILKIVSALAEAQRVKESAN